MPDATDHLTIGFNSTVRRLEALARSRMPSIFSQDAGPDQSETLHANLSVVFICRKNLPDIMTSSFRHLIATSAPGPTRAKLVDLSKQAEEKIARAVGQPRVGVLGVEEATPGAETLLRFVQENIAPLAIPWLDQAPAPSYYPVKIQTAVSVSKPQAAIRHRKRKRKSPQES